MFAGGIKPNVSTLGAEQVEFYSAIDVTKGKKTLELEKEKEKDALQISNAGDQMSEKQLQQQGYKSICESESESENNTIITADDHDAGVSRTITKNNNNNKNNNGSNNEYKNEMLIQQKKEKFFNWFYFSIAFGSFFAYSVVAYLCQNVGFDIGYLVPTVSLLIATITFISFSKYYKVRPVGKYKTSQKANMNKCGCSNNSMVLLFCQIVWHGLFDDTVAVGTMDVNIGVIEHDARAGDYDYDENENKNAKDIDIATGRDCKVHWLDKCKVSLNGRFSDYDVESTKQVLNLLIYYVYFIFFCCMYNYNYIICIMLILLFRL